jgi:hypothetical protein
MKYFLALLAWTTVAPAAAPVLSAASYGNITFGDRLEVAERRLKEHAPDITDPDEAHCRQLSFKAYPGMTFMVEEGVITRAETSAPVPTSVGFTVGAQINDIKKTVPSVIVEPHHYDPDRHYLTFKAKSGKAALLMEEAGGRITDVRGGLIPSVQYVEGCA